SSSATSSYFFANSAFTSLIRGPPVATAIIVALIQSTLERVLPSSWNIFGVYPAHPYPKALDAQCSLDDIPHGESEGAAATRRRAASVRAPPVSMTKSWPPPMTARSPVR